MCTFCWYHREVDSCVVSINKDKRQVKLSTTCLFLWLVWSKATAGLIVSVAKPDICSNRTTGYMTKKRMSGSGFCLIRSHYTSKKERVVSGDQRSVTVNTQPVAFQIGK